MANQLAIVGTMKAMWFFEIVLAVLLAKVLGRQHSTNILKETYPTTRQYASKLNTEDGGWLIRIVTNEGHFACGGAYIAPLIVVTSASCIQPLRNNLNGLIAETGRNQDNEDNFAYIKSMHIPPEYKPALSHMDVAVLGLETPIKGKTTEFIKLCTTQITGRMKLTSYGWGYANTQEKLKSKEPLRTSAPLIDVKTCQREWSTNARTVQTQTTLCVQYEKLGPNQCLYDPGSPLIYKDQFCGIASQSISCLDPALPAIYTDVNKVRDFILLIEAKIRFRIFESIQNNRI